MIFFEKGNNLRLRKKRVGQDYQRTANEGKGEQTKDHHTRTGRLGYGGTAQARGKIKFGEWSGVSLVLKCV